MRLFAAIAILTLLLPLAGECCAHGMEIHGAAPPTQPELHAGADCDCGDEHHGEHQDCHCLCHLPAAPPLSQDAGTALPLIGSIQDSPFGAARHLSVPQDRPPILA